MRRKRTAGQAILEFALALPILFLILYGFLEVGRLIFMYAALVTSSREAVRYGSIVGLNPAGVPNYQNCEGILNRAQKVGFMLHLEESNVTIEYDHEPPPEGQPVVPFDLCNDSDGTDDGVDSDVVVVGGDRVLVTITLDYSPILRFQSFVPRQFETSTARTIMGIVELESP
jgi:hypothetical protein